MFESECELHAPVKAFLEIQGWDVKGEVHGCDLVAARGIEPPVVVELVPCFPGIDRLAPSDLVYLAVPATSRRSRAPSAADPRRISRLLGAHGSTAIAVIRATADASNAGRILYRNVYGWFARTGRATYAITALGERDLVRLSSANAAAPTRMTVGHGAT